MTSIPGSLITGWERTYCMERELWVKGKEKGPKIANKQHIAPVETLQRLLITFYMLMRTHSACKNAAKKLLSKDHCFVLGKGEFG